MRIGLTADLHLDRRLGARTDVEGVNLRSRDLEAATRRVIDGFIASEVEIGVFAGDLFDHPKPSERSRQFLVTEIRRLMAAGIRPVILRGNHDAAAIFSGGTAIGTLALSLPPEAVIVDAYAPYVFRVTPDVAITCVPWLRSDVEFYTTIEALVPVPDAHNILVLHCGVADLPEYAELRPGSQTLTRSLVPIDRFDAIFAGHFHMYRDLPSLRFHFIGSPERLSVSEVGDEKGYLVYDTETGITTRHAIVTRSWYDAILDATDRDGQAIVAEVESFARTIPDWENAIVRLRIEHVAADIAAALDVTSLRAIAGSAFHAELDLRVDDPILSGLGMDEEKAPRFEDLPAEWRRFVGRLDGRTPAERERITDLGLVALGGDVIVAGIGTLPATV